MNGILPRAPSTVLEVGQHEPLRESVRARASGRDLRNPDAGGGQDRVERIPPGTRTSTSRKGQKKMISQIPPSQGSASPHKAAKRPGWKEFAWSEG